MIETSARVPQTAESPAAVFRKSGQPLMPQQITSFPNTEDGYSLYPYHSLGRDKIQTGYDSLARWILTHKKVIIDGYGGVLWNDAVSCLEDAFRQSGASVHWIFTRDYLKEEEQIEALVRPFLGQADSVWGTRYTGSLSDFFHTDALEQVPEGNNVDCTILIGVGAGLCNWDAPIIYLDVPKNEIQYRMRAGSVSNLGTARDHTPAQRYKRCYFVDWVALNAHKKELLPKISVLGDAQWKGSLSWALSGDIRNGLEKLGRSVFRVRPWFEPGAWGGQWMKEAFGELNRDEVNYAWSFELIVPENGLVFESDGNLLELSFDFLMFQGAARLLGQHAAFFGDEFPIRFDFLDTWDGGNLSIQCHPALSYIREHFGEQITQDETYYILDCREDAKVYLGFQEGVEPAAFRQALERSNERKEVVDVEAFVQAHKANRHDLFLIPNGTVHSAGKNNLVLEISATPYIFTFKMYDWLRLDLNGQPRPINIEHAFHNLRFDYRGTYVTEELISHPRTIATGADWELLHLPTHPHHFYDVHRLEFDSEIRVQTDESCHVLMLVEGSALTVLVDGEAHPFRFAETFVIPAAAKEYTLVNRGSGRAKVVKAFIKKSIDFLTR